MKSPTARVEWSCARGNGAPTSHRQCGRRRLSTTALQQERKPHTNTLSLSLDLSLVLLHSPVLAGPGHLHFISVGGERDASLQWLVGVYHL